LASQQFTNEPLKQKKLKSLSPHWLRHLFASHQNKAGVLSTIIKANMRHSSSQTTALSLHAEDTLRYQEVQKINMSVTLKSKELKAQQTPEIQLELYLSGGTVSRLLSLERVLNSIEGNILQDYQWRYQKLSKEDLLAKLKKEIALPRCIPMTYIIEQPSKQELETIQAQIKFESEIRLFNCEIKEKALLHK
jgi:hypothetical protein